MSGRCQARTCCPRWSWTGTTASWSPRPKTTSTCWRLSGSCSSRPTCPVGSVQRWAGDGKPSPRRAANVLLWTKPTAASSHNDAGPTPKDTERKKTDLVTDFVSGERQPTDIVMCKNLNETLRQTLKFPCQAWKHGIEPHSSTGSTEVLQWWNQIQT